MYKLIIEYNNLNNGKYRIETITNKDTIIHEMAFFVANDCKFKLVTDKKTGYDNLVYVSYINDSEDNRIEITRTFVVNLI